MIIQPISFGTNPCNAQSVASSPLSSADVNQQDAVKEEEEAQNGLYGTIFATQEILFKILEEIPPSSIGKTALACRAFAQVFTTKSYWNFRFVFDFPFSQRSVDDPLLDYRRLFARVQAIKKSPYQVSKDYFNGNLGAALINSKGMIAGSSLANLRDPHREFHTFNYYTCQRSARFIIHWATALSMQKETLYAGCANGEIMLWKLSQDSDNWINLSTIRARAQKITALLEIGDHIIAGDRGGWLSAYNRYGEKCGAVLGHLGPVASVIQYQDSFISADCDGYFYEWEITSQSIQKRHSFKRNHKPITCLHSFHNMLLVASLDGIAIWQKTQVGQWHQSCVLPKNPAVVSAFCSHENLVFAADCLGSIRVWEYTRGQWERFDFDQKSNCKQSRIQAIFYSAEKHQLHCVFQDGEICMWDFN